MTDDRIVPLQTNLVCYNEPTASEDREKIPPKRRELDDDDDESDKDCYEILECILPPRRWEDADGTRWMQKVSSRSADRADVVALVEKLETRLRQYGARDTGVCPTRRALYSQCFDEIIRQATVNCAERGLLLMKIRDEFKMTLDAYRTLYESNVKRFGLTKSVLFAEPDVRHRHAELEAKNQKLERDLATSIAKYEAVQARGNEQRAAQQQRHDEKVEFLKRSNRDLRTFLEGITLQ